MKCTVYVAFALWASLTYAEIQFTQVTDEAGIQFRHFSGATGTKHLPETMGGGAAFFDYDNDDIPDLYFVNGASLTESTTNVPPTNRLYRNSGDGTFTDVTQQAGVGNTEYGIGCCVADYDNDGNRDLFVTNFGHNVLYRNNGGWLDLVVVNYVLTDLETAPDCSQNGISAYCRPEDFAPAPDVLYRNNGDGSFTDTELGELHGIARNEHGDAESSMGIDAADYDNDGDFDIILTHYQAETNTLYQNDGNGVFWDVTAQSRLSEPTLLPLAWGTGFVDIDNDGWLDLFFANGHLHDNIEALEEIGAYKQQNQLFHNQQDGTYADISDTSGSGMLIEKSSRGTIFGDYDNDGDLDILVMNIADTPDLLRNDTPPLHHWLRIKLIGKRSNRDGIGARVTLQSGDMHLLREVKSGASYLSQNSHQLIIGLGTIEQIDRLVVQWQSGIRDEMENVQCNQWLTIQEGAGIITRKR